MKEVFGRWSAVALALCAAPPSAAAGARSPSVLALDQSSPTALVVVKSDWWRPAASMKSAYKIALSTYDPVERKILGGPYSGGLLIEAKEKNFADGYLIVPIKPGRWVFESYSQQDKWALCFNAASLQFDVKPGEVLFLGRFDALEHRRQLGEVAVKSGKASIRGYGFADFFDLPEGPRFGSIDEAQLSAVREMLGRNAPGVTAPVHAAEYLPATFGTGSTLFAERKCGGYFATGAKKTG